MDFVFNCASCRGTLIARTDLRGLHVQCAHCSGGTEVSCGRRVTEAVVTALLDSPLPAAPSEQRILRRVRPAARHSSGGTAHHQPKRSRAACITHLL